MFGTAVVHTQSNRGLFFIGRYVEPPPRDMLALRALGPKAVSGLYPYCS